MKHNFRKKLLAAVLLSALVLSSGNNMAYAKTAKAPTLNVKKSISLQVGTSKKIKVKSGGVSKIVKVSWKSSKNCIKLSRKSGTSVKAIAVKKGKATLTANVKYIKKLSADSSYASKKLKCKIKAVNKVSGNINNTAYTSVQPSATAAVNNNTSGDNNINGTSPVPSPTATPIPSGTLLSVLSPYVENVGTCVSYNSWGSGRRSAGILCGGDRGTGKCACRDPERQRTEKRRRGGGADGRAASAGELYFDSGRSVSGCIYSLGRKKRRFPS